MIIIRIKSTAKRKDVYLVLDIYFMTNITKKKRTHILIQILNDSLIDNKIENALKLSNQQSK